MSEERDGTTTGWVDRGPQGRSGATAVPDPRAEVRTSSGGEASGAEASARTGDGPELPRTGPGAPGAGPAAPESGPAAPGSAPGTGPAASPSGGQPAPGHHMTQPVSVPPAQPAGQPGAVPGPQPAPRPDAHGPVAGDQPPAAHPTAPVSVRPRPRTARRDSMIRMGPWAPVAGAVVGLLLGVVVVVLLAPAVETFAERLSLVFVVLGLALLGAGGTLLADEVRLLRRGTQAIEARSVSVIAGLLNGLTPARLLITASAFCLLLSAYVTGRQ